VENQGPTKEMLKVEDAINIIVSNATSLQEEIILLKNSLNRVNSTNVYANINSPPENVSSMDGYALKYSSIKNITKKPIKIVGESAAGKPYLKKLKNFECVEIYTGAEVPKGANLILLQERVIINNNYIVSTNQNYKKEQYIRKKGMNFKNNSLIIKKNSLITSRNLSLAISSNHTKINVYKKPNIAILATGNELRNPSEKINKAIISSNTPLLLSLINSFGAKAHDLGIAKDSVNSLIKKLKNLDKFDILITTGGASVGKHDLVKDVLNKLGMCLIFWKVAIRPGKPLIFGKLDKTLILGFPGNPVSTFVSTLIFLRPLIDKYLKIKSKPTIKNGILTKPLNKNDEREEYLRAKIFFESNMYKVIPLSGQDSSMTSYLSNADGLIIRKPFDKALKIGSKVTILVFSEIHPHI
jgi:molybdopterin molybdotransferase